MTKGMKSSEFWVTIIGTAVNLGNQIFGWGIDASALLAATTPLIGYVLSRGFAKTD